MDTPLPGETCELCRRRVPHPRKEASPKTAVVSYRVPLDEIEAHREILETAAKFLGAHERPYWQFATYALALYAVLQDESLKGFAHRSHVA